MSYRNISRMPKRYRDRMLHVMNAPEQMDYFTDMNTSLEKKRALYAKFGKRSGIDPGLLWPSAENLAEQLEFEGVGGRRVIADFEGGAMTSDAGALLLRHADRAIKLIDRVAGCFVDHRSADFVVHGLRVGASACSIQARKRRPLIGPSNTQGAVTPS